MNNKLLLDNLRCIPDWPKKGVNFRDVTTLFKNNECLQEICDEMYELYKDKGITKIVGDRVARLRNVVSTRTAPRCRRCIVP